MLRSDALTTLYLSPSIEPEYFSQVARRAHRRADETKSSLSTLSENGSGQVKTGSLRRLWPKPPCAIGSTYLSPYAIERRRVSQALVIPKDGLQFPAGNVRRSRNSKKKKRREAQIVIAPTSFTNPRRLAGRDVSRACVVHALDTLSSAFSRSVLWRST